MAIDNTTLLCYTSLYLLGKTQREHRVTGVIVHTECKRRFGRGIGNTIVAVGALMLWSTASTFDHSPSFPVGLAFWTLAVLSAGTLVRWLYSEQECIRRDARSANHRYSQLCRKRLARVEAANGGPVLTTEMVQDEFRLTFNRDICGPSVQPVPGLRQ